MEKNKIIPLFSHNITKEDKKSVINALNNQILTGGPILEEFEKKFASFVNARYAIGVSNATSALFLSLKALGIGKNDEVIVPDMTFVATANSVIHTGAKPVIVDVDLSDLNISIESINNAITKKTKAILPVHFAGRPCNMKEIKKIIRDNKLFLIEDCAHAIGTMFNGKHVGLFGNAGCFSFYPTKNFTTIEGGMVITNSKEISEKIKILRNHGMTKTLQQRYKNGNPWEYDVIESGYNFRLDEIRSALGISQLKRIRINNRKRKLVAEYYSKNLKNVKGINIPTNSYGIDSHHLYIIRINEKFNISRDELYKKLLDNNIISTIHYKPLHLFTAYKKFNIKSLKNSKKIYEEILTLPFFPEISKKQQDKVIEIILESN